MTARRARPAQGTPSDSTAELVDDIREFRKSPVLVGPAPLDRVWHAPPDVVAEDQHTHSLDGGSDRGELLEDVYTQPRLVHHVLNALYLPLDLAETLGDLFLAIDVNHAVPLRSVSFTLGAAASHAALT